MLGVLKLFCHVLRGTSRENIKVEIRLFGTEISKVMTVPEFFIAALEELLFHFNLFIINKVNYNLNE